MENEIYSNNTRSYADKNDLFDTGYDKNLPILGCMDFRSWVSDAEKSNLEKSSKEE